MKISVARLVSAILILCLGLETAVLPYKAKPLTYPSNLSPQSQIEVIAPSQESENKLSERALKGAEFLQGVLTSTTIVSAIAYSSYFEKNKLVLISTFLVYELLLNSIAWGKKIKSASKDKKKLTTVLFEHRWKFLGILLISLPFAPIVAASVSTVLFESFYYWIIPIVLAFLVLNRTNHFLKDVMVIVHLEGSIVFRILKKTRDPLPSVKINRSLLFQSLSFFVLFLSTNSLIILTLFPLSHEHLKFPSFLFENVGLTQLATETQSKWRAYVGVREGLGGEPEFDVEIQPQQFYGYEKDSLLSKLIYPIQKSVLNSVLNKKVNIQVDSGLKDEDYFNTYYLKELKSAFYLADNNVPLSTDEIKAFLDSEKEDHWLFAFILLEKSNFPELKTELLELKNEPIIHRSDFVRLWYLRALTHNLSDLDEDVKDEIVNVIIKLRETTREENTNTTYRNSFIF